MNVEWREINPDYIVSSDGQVGSRQRKGLKMLSLLRTNGYLCVWISTDKGKKLRKVHQLVAEAFLGPKPTPLHEVNHKNGIRSDNRDHNLEWVTNSQNSRHRFYVLKHGAVRGEAQGGSKLTEADVRVIRDRLLAGEFQRAIAADYGVCVMTICHIATGRSWAWLDKGVSA